MVLPGQNLGGSAPLGKKNRSLQLNSEIQGWKQAKNYTVASKEREASLRPLSPESNISKLQQYL